jgi:cytochrome oxidase Cu insertion factor (SCO1/SenC/PrrC family)
LSGQQEGKTAMRQHTGSYGPLTGAGRGLLLPLLAIAFMGVTGWLASSTLPWRDLVAEGPAAPVIETRSLLALVDHRGQRLAPAALEKPATLVFFGYTHCPDVCPLELATMAAALDRLGPAADDVAAFFVSVDPERDTPEQLAAYVALFHPRITGLTGTTEAVAAAAGAFRAYYARVEQADGAYTMDHFARTLVLDRDGQLRAAVPFDSPPETLESAIRPLLAGAPAS